MPTPVSLTSSSTWRGASGVSRPPWRNCRVRTVRVPPSGMASTALKMRLVSASRISTSEPMMSGRFSASSVLQLDDDAALLRLIAPARAREVDDLLDEAIAGHA